MAVAAASAMPLAVLADELPRTPAVSGLNGKLSGEGGLYDDEGTGLLQGSLTTPVGRRFALQVDGALATLDGETLSGVGVHLFRRDPSRYLFGVYASYHAWNSIDISRLAAEGEFYRGRWTFGGILGWESVDVPSTKGGLAVLTRDDDHFFNELNLAWYPKDNLKLSVGYHFENERSLGTVELERQLRWPGVPASLFAVGNFGDEDRTRITGGVRFYFGADRAKSLIRRHREDDPPSYTPVFPNIVTTTNGGQSFCPVNTPVPVGSCTCPPGSFVINQGSVFVCSTDVE